MQDLWKFSQWHRLDPQIHDSAIPDTAEVGHAMAVFYQNMQTGKDAGVAMVLGIAGGNLQFLRNDVMIFHSNDIGNDTSTQTFWLVG